MTAYSTPAEYAEAWHKMQDLLCLLYPEAYPEGSKPGVGEMLAMVEGMAQSRNQAHYKELQMRWEWDTARAQLGEMKLNHSNLLDITAQWEAAANAANKTTAMYDEMVSKYKPMAHEWNQVQQVMEKSFGVKVSTCGDLAFYLGVQFGKKMWLHNRVTEMVDILDDHHTPVSTVKGAGKLMNWLHAVKKQLEMWQKDGL